MKVRKININLGFLIENCYLIEIDNKCLIVDPGGESKKIKETIVDKDVLAILITHNHFDHVGALSELTEFYKVPVFEFNNVMEQEYQVGQFIFDVIFTPGHSKDSVTYYFKKEDIMFVGDFIFKDSIGRCDLPGGSEREMFRSLQKIKGYNDAKIYSGHGEVTTLVKEKRNNPYFKQSL